MGCCYLLKIALQAWFTSGLLLPTEESIAGRIINGLLLSMEDSIAGRV